MPEDRQPPKIGDTATLKLGDFLHDAVCERDIISGDVCWKLETGTVVDWRRANLYEGKVKKTKTKAKVKAKSAETLAEDTTADATE